MDGEGAIVGPDGRLTLAVTVVVALASLGIGPLLALAVVGWRGWRAPMRAGPVGAGPVEAGPARGVRILVLGARLPPSGRPGRVFQARLARAAALWAADNTARIVLLGGARHPGAPTEAEAGRALLIAHGVPDCAIAVETRSRHTLENLRCYRAGLPASDAPASDTALLVTSRTHLARSLAMAAGLGLAPLPCAAEAGRWAAFHPWAWPREAWLLLWYVVGSRFAALSGNRRMLARIG